MPKKIVLVLFSLCSLFVLPAHAGWNDQIVHLKTQSTMNLPQMVSKMQYPQVIILAEAHDSIPDHQNQVRLLNEVAKQGAYNTVSVGMEFFDYTKQELVDKYLDGEIDEHNFLKSVGWGKNDFNLYKTQVLFPLGHKGRTYALNLPKYISNKISFKGMDSLTEKEAALLPPDFEIGNFLYRQRFVKYITSVHPEIPPEGIQNFFTAHSSWDDTMAWRISEALEENPYQMIFVIVGKFHAEYGGGLPDRLRARGINSILTITQYDASKGKLGDLYKYIQPHPDYGFVSDLVWVQGEPRR